MAALSILCRMMDDPFFKQKNILLVDADDKQRNDRTWSFWEREPGYFEDLVHRKWTRARVAGQDWTKTFDLAPYTYKSIRAIDFYSWVFSLIDKFDNIHFLKTKIEEVQDGKPAYLKTQSGSYSADLILDSLVSKEDLSSIKTVPLLYQHFKGYFVDLKQPMDDSTITFMDFSIPQCDTMQFMYVLPFTRHNFLVEHTYFSQRFVSEQTYDQSLTQYCNQQFGTDNWQISEVEKGVIPMTTASLKKPGGVSVASIGTKGGYTKASSGYTFYFVQREALKTVKQIKQGVLPSRKPSRFKIYDALLLRVLAADEQFGHQLFSDLFKYRSPELVFTFLNEESNLLQDLYITSNPPTLPFLRSLVAEMGYHLGEKLSFS
jgi:lycopene beta-cyclase